MCRRSGPRTRQKDKKKKKKINESDEPEVCLSFSLPPFFPSFLISLCFFFSFLFWTPPGIWSSQTRDQIQVSGATYTAAVAMLEPLTHCAGWESNLSSDTTEMLSVPVCHSGRSVCLFFRFHFLSTIMNIPKFQV